MKNTQFIVEDKFDDVIKEDTTSPEQISKFKNFELK